MDKELSEFTRKIGLNIKRRREKRLIDQKPLAELAGTSATTLSSIELGKTATSVAQILAIARALECEPWELLVTGEGNSPPPDDAVLTEIREMKALLVQRLPEPRHSDLFPLFGHAVVALATLDEPDLRNALGFIEALIEGCADLGLDDGEDDLPVDLQKKPQRPR